MFFISPDEEVGDFILSWGTIYLEIFYCGVSINPFPIREEETAVLYELKNILQHSILLHDIYYMPK